MQPYPQHRAKRRLALWCCLIISLAVAPTLLAQELKPAAEIIALTGQAEIKPAADPSFQVAQLKDQLFPRDQIRTLAESKAKLWCQDESILVLGEKTTLEIAQYLVDETAGRRQSLLRALTGKMRFIVHKFFEADLSDFTIETPTTIIGVRGTDGIVKLDEQDQVYLLEAINPLSVKNKSTGEQLDLKPMTFAILEAAKPIQVKPITPVMYKSLTEEFQLSYDYDPENLTQPPSPLVGDDTKKPATALPPVDQAPLPVIHPKEETLPIIHPKKPSPPTPRPKPE
ncbi:MAG: FecR domain-containing protein [Desulfobacteraceae bacterium]